MDTTPETAAVTEHVAAAIAALATAWTTYADSRVTLSDPRPDPSALLAAAGQLREQMPDFDVTTGALPWEIDQDLDPEAPEGPGWVDAAFEVLYTVHVLSRATSVSNQAHHLVELSNHVGDLGSWHPQCDPESGEITTAKTITD